MINGKEVPTQAVIAGLAKKLDSDPRYLEKLAAEIEKDIIKRSLRTGGCRFYSSWPVYFLPP